MKIVIVSPQWTEDPLFDLGFHEVFHDGLGKDVYAHVTALGSLVQPQFTLRKYLPRVPRTTLELGQAVHNATRSAHALLALAIAPQARPGALAPQARSTHWVQKPGLTFRSINDRYFAAWARESSIDTLVLVGIAESAKVNLLTSAKNIVEIKIERTRPQIMNGSGNMRQRDNGKQGDNGNLVIRTLVESGAACNDLVRMELGDLSQLDSQMIGELAVSYFNGFMAKNRQQDLDDRPKVSATEPEMIETSNIELVTRHNG